MWTVISAFIILAGKEGLLLAHGVGLWKHIATRTDKANTTTNITNRTQKIKWFLGIYMIMIFLLSVTSLSNWESCCDFHVGIIWIQAHVSNCKILDKSQRSLSFISKCVKSAIFNKRACSIMKLSLEHKKNTKKTKTYAFIAQIVGLNLNLISFFLNKVPVF